MAKKTECIVCYENKFMTPCGALNSCNVYVCDDCKYDNELKNSEEAVWGYNSRCIICKELEYKRAIYFNYYDFINDGCGIYNKKTKKYNQPEADGDVPLFDYMLKLFGRE